MLFCNFLIEGSLKLLFIILFPFVLLNEYIVEGFLLFIIFVLFVNNLLLFFEILFPQEWFFTLCELLFIELFIFSFCWSFLSKVIFSQVNIFLSFLILFIELIKILLFLFLFKLDFLLLRLIILLLMILIFLFFY